MKIMTNKQFENEIYKAKDEADKWARIFRELEEIREMAARANYRVDRLEEMVEPRTEQRADCGWGEPK